MNPDTKYLTYTPWPGQLNNTRMCFETALVLAFLSNRCLVTPKAYRSHREPEWENGSFRPLHPQECHDLDALNTIVELIPYEEYERRVPAGAQVRSAELDFQPGEAVFCVPSIPPRDSVQAARLRDFAAGRQQFLEFTPETTACHTLHLKSATLEHFYCFFYFSRGYEEQQCKRFVRDHVKFRIEIIATAARIAVALGNYCAMHVRRNDFLLQYAEQDIPVNRLLTTLASRVPRGTRLYIATDEQDKNFFSALRTQYELYFIDDIETAIPAEMPAPLRACVEQMICAFAELFIGTRLSTFSGYINRLRGYYGAPDKNIYFTDGFSGSDADDQGSPAFSWLNWIRTGNPWWGREFKEGWEVHA